MLPVSAVGSPIASLYAVDFFDQRSLGHVCANHLFMQLANFLPEWFRFQEIIFYVDFVSSLRLKLNVGVTPVLPRVVAG